ncbi:MAG: hypothetical protein KDC98_13555 [Planctomycetes bacterium]|nr:hypothetical protein [Planctomycetota bacterium]
MHRHALSLTLLTLLAPIAAQKPRLVPVSEERLLAAYADARAACEEVLGASLDELPPLKLVEPEDVARVIANENLPAIRLRQCDEDKAEAEAAQLSRELARFVFAKYAWSTKTFLVVAATWEASASVLRRPELTTDHTLRAVMVHELCHAIDDLRFDFGRRMLATPSTDSVAAFSAVMEGHAQLAARRVCKVRGWSDGFEALTGSIGAVPAGIADSEEASAFLMRAQAAALASAYLDGERFVTTVLEARPESGRRDIFESPPLDPETILQPQWYLDPSTRPALLYELEPAIDAFVARFDPAIWSSMRGNVTGKQIATGLTMLEAEEVDAFVASLRAARMVQLAPTAAPQSKIAILIAMEFDSEDAARRWVDMSGRVSDHKDDTMDKGMIRILDSKTTQLAPPSPFGLMQQKTMRNGRLEFEVATIDAARGRVVLETIYSGDPPDVETHDKTVRELFGLIVSKAVEKPKVEAAK